jgi:hypothetical protein
MALRPSEGGLITMYTKSWEIEGLEEKVTELENKQEEAASLLDDVLELLDHPDSEIFKSADSLDVFLENLDHAVKVIKDVIKELS